MASLFLLLQPFRTWKFGDEGSQTAGGLRGVQPYPTFFLACTLFLLENISFLWGKFLCSSWAYHILFTLLLLNLSPDSKQTRSSPPITSVGSVKMFLLWPIGRVSGGRLRVPLPTEASRRLWQCKLNGRGSCLVIGGKNWLLCEGQVPEKRTNLRL